MHLSATRSVDAAAEEVFAFLSDAANNPRWQSGMRSCEWITPPPISVGSRYAQEARFLGRPIRSTFEVTGLEPGRSITIATVESTFPIRVTRSVETTSETTCRVTAHISGGPRVPGLSGLVRRLAQRSVDADYDRLVAHFQAAGTENQRF